MSRIPPHLVRLTHACLYHLCSRTQQVETVLLPQKPHKLRNMLTSFGDIERLYLAPEGSCPSPAG